MTKTDLNGKKKKQNYSGILLKEQIYKHEFVLKSCPWCGKTPQFCLNPYQNQGNTETWLWFIQCQNPLCSMQPKTKDVPIRKTSQYILSKQIEKVEKLVDIWNAGNQNLPKEKTIVEFRIDLNQVEINRMRSGTSSPVFIEWNDIKRKKPKNKGRFLVFMECQSHMHSCAVYDYPYPCCSVNIMYWNGKQWYSHTKGNEVTSYVKKWAKIPEVK